MKCSALTLRMVMNKNKICAFFGHRKINVTQELVNNLKLTIEDLIVNKNVSIFLFGSNSEFNDLCHKVVTQLKQSYTFIKRISYTCKSEVCILECERLKWEEIYSNTLKQEVHLLGFEEEFEHKTKYVSGKAGYVERNYAMINDSDYCVFYYDEDYLPPKRKRASADISFYQPKSGTDLAYKYAIQKNKVIINILLEQPYLCNKNY